MKVLVLANNYPNTIKEISCLFYRDQVNAIRKQNIDVTVLVYTPVSLRDIVKTKKFDFGEKITCKSPFTALYQFPQFPVSQKMNRLFRNYFYKRLLNKYINKVGLPDIVHAHTYIAGKFAFYLKKKHKVPYVITEHLTAFTRNILSERELLNAKTVYGNSCKNIAVSNEFTSMLNKKFNLEFTFIPNVVDANYFKPIEKKVKLNDEQIFINIGHLHVKKNQNMLIKAFAKSFKGNLNYKLWIVGGGERFSALKSLVEKEELTDQVVLWGAQKRDKVRELIQKSDYFVLASKQETFGVVLIEAMSCGLPVISTRSGGPESIITDDKLGILCEINEDSIAKSMKNVVEMNWDQNFIREYIVSEFSENAIGEKLKKIYQNVLNNI